MVKHKWQVTCWYLDAYCPICGGRLATSGRVVWCTNNDLGGCTYGYEIKEAED